MTSNATGLLRPHYFDRQQLTAADLNRGQDYLRERLRRHNRFLHGWGVVCGAQVSPGEKPWEVQVSEGYVITARGDEVYIPSDTPPIDIKAGVQACLGPLDPCPAPENLEELVEDGVLRIADATINPPGKDVSGAYNEEWVEVLALEETGLDGYTVQHTINPGTDREAPEDYYTFQEETRFAANTVIRIHSGAEADHTDPEPGIIHRYVAAEGQVGNWRLNNTGDRIRVLDPQRRIVHVRTFFPPVYLVVYPSEEGLCPQPAVPEDCQPPGGTYKWSRMRETCRFEIVCDLPPSHQEPSPSCKDLTAYVCDQTHVPCPPQPNDSDSGVVLAEINVTPEEEECFEIDDLSQRRQVISHALLQAYLRCQCEAVPAPKAAFTASSTSGQAPLAVTFTDKSTGDIDAWSWNFGDGGTSTQQSPTHTYTSAGSYTVTLTVSGLGGMATASHTITVRVEPPNADFVAQPVSGTAPLSVTFSDRSSGEITGWAWSFGDGGTSSQQNPQHTYQAPGIYTVTLTVTGPGETATASHTITVRAEPPNAAFRAEPVSGTAPLRVTFTDRSSGEITGWDWNFGDGGTSSQQNPVYTYTGSGTYTVTLTVTGPGGTATASDTIRVGRWILDISPGVVNGSFKTEHEVRVLGVGLTDANRVEFSDIENIMSATITDRQSDHIVLLVRLSPNPTNNSRSPFTVSFPDGTKLSSGNIMLRILNIRIINVPGESFPVELDENEFDLVRGREEPVEAVGGIGGTRGGRLREAAVDNILVLAILPPEETAEIAKVNVEMATRWRDEARELLRR